MTPEEVFLQALADRNTADHYVKMTKAQKVVAESNADKARLDWGAALNAQADAEKAVDLAEAGIILALREKAARV